MEQQRNGRGEVGMWKWVSVKEALCEEHNQS